MNTDYLSLLTKYVSGKGPRMSSALIIHSALVTNKALAIAKAWMKKSGEVVDLRLLEELSMLHDVGIFHTDVPSAELYGKDHYVTHTMHGHRMLLDEGLPLHANAARTHMNIDASAIKRQKLPLPHEDLIPETVEEEILSLADYSYSKRFDSLFMELDDAQIRETLARFEPEAVERYERLRKKYFD